MTSLTKLRKIKISNRGPRRPLVIAVIGAGPAGLSTAMALAKGLENFPKGSHIRLFDKAGSIDNIIAFHSSSVYESHPKPSGLLSDNQSECIDWSCPDVLDNCLVEAQAVREMLAVVTALGVELHTGLSFHKARKYNGKTLLKFIDADKEIVEFKADFVVDASGKDSVYANTLGINRECQDEATYLQALVDNPGGEVGRSFVEAVEPGWWYAANLAEDKMLISLCTEGRFVREQASDLSDRWLKLLNQTAWVRQQVPNKLFGKDHQNIEITVQNEPATLLSQIGGEHWLAVGDAASCYDPITNGGWHKAINHGQEAGLAIVESIWTQSAEPLSNYCEMVIKDFHSHIGSGIGVSIPGNHFDQAQFWFRCFSSQAM